MDPGTLRGPAPMLGCAPQKGAREKVVFEQELCTVGLSSQGEEKRDPVQRWR